MECNESWRKLKTFQRLTIELVDYMQTLDLLIKWIQNNLIVQNIAILNLNI